MNKMKSVFAFVLTVFAILVIMETAQAQRRVRARGGARRDVRVVRVRHTTVVRKAHVRYARLPRWGAKVATIPATAVIIKTQRHPYYFWDGVYYTNANSHYVVVRPVPGVRIKVLPAGHRKILVGPRPYYYYYGTFYTKVDTTDEYETVDAPAGAVVDALPDGYEVKNISGTEYYVLDGVYYSEVEAPEFEDKVGYEVVKV